MICAKFHEHRLKCHSVGRRTEKESCSAAEGPTMIARQPLVDLRLVPVARILAGSWKQIQPLSMPKWLVAIMRNIF